MAIGAGGGGGGETLLEDVGGEGIVVDESVAVAVEGARPVANAILSAIALSVSSLKGPVAEISPNLAVCFSVEETQPIVATVL